MKQQASMYVQLKQTFCILAAVFMLTQGASLRSQEHITNNDLTDDWYRCQGLPCDQYEEVQKKIQEINYLENERVKEKVDPGMKFSDFLEYHHQSIDEIIEEDDILYTPEQLDSMLEDAKSHHRIKRKVDSFRTELPQKWELPIHYMFDDNFDSEDREIVRQALAHWQSQTCIEFVESPTSQTVDKYHLVFTSSQQRTCASFIGKIEKWLPNKKQPLILAKPCLRDFGTPLHEIAHALGSWHEHQRPIRDSYIRILGENIRYSAGMNFKEASTYDINNYGLSYDYNSVMHYGAYIATRNGRRTLETKDKLFKYNIGQRVDLSFLDVKAINMAYCSKKCPTVLPYPCQHGGYQDPKNCNRCRCPPGLSGTLCEEVAASYSPAPTPCGGTINLASGEVQYIESPGYSQGEKYQDGTSCSWHAKVPANHRVELKFEGDFSIYCSRERCFHWLEVRFQKDFSLPGPRFCCLDTPQEIITSESEEMLITFRANATNHIIYDSQRKGFMAKIYAKPLKDENIPKEIEHTTTKEPPTTTVKTTTTTTQTTTPTTTTTTTPSKTSTQKSTTTTTTTRGSSESTSTTTTTTTVKPSTTTTLRPTTTTTTTTSSTTPPSSESIESWSPWSSCSKRINNCHCGGCSFRQRVRLCDGKPCVGDKAQVVTEACDSRLCMKADYSWVFIGRLYKKSCPECCPNFKKVGDACVPIADFV